MQRRAAGSGFDWRTKDGVLGKVREELQELERALPGERPSPAERDRVEEELGDLLFAVASVGRWAGVDPESALRLATRRFAERFDRLRDEAAAEGVRLDDLSEDELLARFRRSR